MATGRAQDGSAVLDRLASDRSQGLLQRAAQAAKELLDLDVAIVSAFDEGNQVYLAVEGSAFDMKQGGTLALESTVCQRVIEGRTPPLIRDMAAEPSVADLGVVDDGIASYVGVPLELSDGTLFGTLCAVGSETAERLEDRDLEFMRVIARIISDYLEREEAVARSEAARADVFARVTHDLRNPLQAILGFAQLIAKTKDPQHAGTIADAAQRLNQMLDELVQTRTAPGAMEHEPISLNEVAASQVALFEGLTAAHVLQIDAPEPVEVVGDRARTGGVLANLLSNAVKYSPDGGPVTVSVHRVGDRGRVEVTDEGIGIPADEAEAIFTRFFRSTSGAEHGISGTGLGLALSRDVIRAQGGEMGFTSVAGEGSTFWLELPG